MSLKTIKSGTSSACTCPSTQAANSRSIAAAKFVEPPQGARDKLRICSTGDEVAGILCHRGCDSKVNTRCRKGSSAKSDTNNPSAMDTSIGTPLIEPETSTRAVSAPLFVPVEAICSTTSLFMVAHCAFTRSSSSVDACLPPITRRTNSCGKHCLPLILSEARTASRTCCRHVTRSSSSGCLSPVRSSSTVSGRSLLNFSFKKPRRDFARHRDGTAATSISAQRLPHIFTSGTSSFEVKRAIAFLYSALALPPGKSLEATAAPKGANCFFSRGAYFAARDGFPESRSLRSCST
mmetsp:Transcript_18965/g.54139  ORF Transcript_18965/g.54139 Transcript_18965/m.54139 type:complete len:293 (+) Transcript_18965:497-1375(+)